MIVSLTFMDSELNSTSQDLHIHWKSRCLDYVEVLNTELHPETCKFRESIFKAQAYRQSMGADIAAEELWTEDAYLRELVNLKLGKPPIILGVDMELLLCQVYMERLNDRTSDKELMAYGRRFKNILKLMVAEKEHNMRLAGEL